MPLKFTLSPDLAAFKADPASPQTPETARLHPKVAEGGWRLTSIAAPAADTADLCPAFILSHGEVAPGTGCLTVKTGPDVSAGDVLAELGFPVSKRLSAISPMLALTERLPIGEIGQAIVALSADARITVVEPEIVEYLGHR